MRDSLGVLTTMHGPGKKKLKAIAPPPCPPHIYRQPTLTENMVKRKAQDNPAANGKSKKRALSDDEARSNFRKGLFDTKVLGDYQNQYAESQP